MGRQYRILARGTYIAAATPTLTLTLKLGATTMGTTPVATMGTLTNVVSWNMEATFQCYNGNPAVSGLINANGLFNLGTANNGDGVRTFVFPNSATAPGNVNYYTIDTTVPQAITLVAQWGTASTGNQITLQQMSVEALGGLRE
jgi:hypothetical protein